MMANCHIYRNITNMRPCPLKWILHIWILNFVNDCQPRTVWVVAITHWVDIRSKSLVEMGRDDLFIQCTIPLTKQTEISSVFAMQLKKRDFGSKLPRRVLSLSNQGITYVDDTHDGYDITYSGVLSPPSNASLTYVVHKNATKCPQDSGYYFCTIMGILQNSDVVPNSPSMEVTVVINDFPRTMDMMTFRSGDMKSSVLKTGKFTPGQTIFISCTGDAGTSSGLHIRWCIKRDNETNYSVISENVTEESSNPTGCHYRQTSVYKYSVTNEDKTITILCESGYNDTCGSGTARSSSVIQKEGINVSHTMSYITTTDSISTEEITANATESSQSALPITSKTLRSMVQGTTDEMTSSPMALPLTSAIPQSNVQITERAVTSSQTLPLALEPSKSTVHTVPSPSEYSNVLQVASSFTTIQLSKPTLTTPIESTTFFTSLLRTFSYGIPKTIPTTTIVTETIPPSLPLFSSAIYPTTASSQAKTTLSPDVFISASESPNTGPLSTGHLQKHTSKCVSTSYTNSAPSKLLSKSVIPALPSVRSETLQVASSITQLSWTSKAIHETHSTKHLSGITKNIQEKNFSTPPSGRSKALEEKSSTKLPSGRSKTIQQTSSTTLLSGISNHKQETNSTTVAKSQIWNSSTLALNKHTTNHDPTVTASDKQTINYGPLTTAPHKHTINHEVVTATSYMHTINQDPLTMASDKHTVNHDVVTAASGMHTINHDVVTAASDKHTVNHDVVTAASGKHTISHGPISMESDKHTIINNPFTTISEKYTINHDAFSPYTFITPITNKNSTSRALTTSVPTISDLPISVQKNLNPPTSAVTYFVSKEKAISNTPNKTTMKQKTLKFPTGDMKSETETRGIPKKSSLFKESTAVELSTWTTKIPTSEKVNITSTSPTVGKDETKTTTLNIVVQLSSFTKTSKEVTKTVSQQLKSKLKTFTPSDGSEILTQPLLQLTRKSKISFPTGVTAMKRQPSTKLPTRAFVVKQETAITTLLSTKLKTKAFPTHNEANVSTKPTTKLTTKIFTSHNVVNVSAKPTTKLTTKIFTSHNVVNVSAKPTTKIPSIQNVANVSTKPPTTTKMLTTHNIVFGSTKATTNYLATVTTAPSTEPTTRTLATEPTTRTLATNRAKTMTKVSQAMKWTLKTSTAIKRTIKTSSTTKFKLKPSSTIKVTSKAFKTMANMKVSQSTIFKAMSMTPNKGSEVVKPYLSTKINTKGLKRTKASTAMRSLTASINISNATRKTSSIGVPTTSSRVTTRLSIPTTSARVKTRLSVPTTSAKVTTRLGVPTTSARVTTRLSVPTTSARVTTRLSVPTTSARVTTRLGVPTTSARVTTRLSVPITSARVTTRLSVPTTSARVTTKLVVPTTSARVTTRLSVPTTSARVTTRLSVPTTSARVTTRLSVLGTASSTSAQMVTSIDRGVSSWETVEIGIFTAVILTVMATIGIGVKLILKLKSSVKIKPN